MYNLLKPVGVFILTITLLSTIQWTCIQLLSTWCHSTGFHGFFINPLILGSPMCVALNTVQITLAKYYITIFTTTVTFITSWMFQVLSFDHKYISTQNNNKLHLENFNKTITS